MTTLRQVLASHRSALVLDAASSRVQVGWLDGDGKESWHASDAEAGIGVFQCIEALGRNPTEADAFIFCDGPGSILGIRTTAMALRTWQLLRARPMFAYCSLALVAHAAGPGNLTVIADARRDRWHSYTISGGLRRAPAAQLGESLMMPQGFRHWSPLPPNVQIVPYSVRDLFGRLADADLLSATDAPDAFLHEEPSYITWTPQIHRAPSAS
jgi:tRNA threonylcarbamoyladenosine biosynthesis protein TsaB